MGVFKSGEFRLVAEVKWCRRSSITSLPLRRLALQSWWRLRERNETRLRLSYCHVVWLSLTSDSSHTWPERNKVDVITKTFGLLLGHFYTSIRPHLILITFAWLSLTIIFSVEITSHFSLLLLNILNISFVLKVTCQVLFWYTFHSFLHSFNWLLYKIEQLLIVLLYDCHSHE